MRWVTNKKQHEYMKHRAAQNLSKALINVNENWATTKLSETGLKWKRQAQWGARIFDFWNAEKGIAVEIDGSEHRADYDQARDRYNYLRSGIVVIRIRNRNEDDMQSAMRQILESCTWRERRESLGLSGHTKKGRRAQVMAAGLKIAHGKW